MQGFRRSLAALLGATIGLVVIGVIVRATDSGMGCPDWPLCYGEIIPPIDDYKAWLEWIHRAAAAVIGLITLIVVALALRSLKGRRSLQGASLALLVLVAFQAWLGRQTVLEFNSGQSVTAHLATAMAFVGLQVWVLARSGYPERLSGIFEARGAVIAPIIAAGSIYALLMFGSNVTGTDTGLLYPDWPLMGGAAFPPVTELSTPHIVHRYATGIVGLILVSALWIVRREPGSPRQTARLLTAAIGLFLVQCLIGALQIFTKLAPWTQTLHVALATLIWILVVGAATVALLEARRANTETGGDTERAAPRSSTRSMLSAYIALTKPRIVELLLITTVPAMFLAAQGVPPLILVLCTLIGGTLSAASANVFNCIVDADIDKQMTRTAGRPLVTGEISTGAALLFASVLGAASFLFLAATTTLMAAFISLLAIGFYVLIYTLILKRSTPQNIVIGGAAGALPPVIGWAAVTGDVSLAPILLFALVFYWTPPHFWALAIKYKDDYSAAGIPMLPSVSSQSSVIGQMWFHTIAMVISSTALIQLAGLPVWALCATVLLGALFTFQLFALKESSENYDRVAAGIFHWSITYLSLLSVLLVVAQLVSA